MKFLFDLFPVILFFAAFKFYGIFIATAVAIIATIGQIIYSKIRHGKVDHMLLVSGGIIGVLGGATLLLHDQTFILWKPTVLYWIIAIALIISQIFFKKNLMRAVMEKQMSMPDSIWARLNIAWALFFIALGFINLYVAFHYPLNTWVNFKLFGITGLMFVFIIMQTLLVSKYIMPASEIEDNKKDNK